MFLIFSFFKSLCTGPSTATELNNVKNENNLSQDLLKKKGKMIFTVGKVQEWQTKKNFGHFVKETFRKNFLNFLKTQT